MESIVWVALPLKVIKSASLCAKTAMSLMLRTTAFVLSAPNPTATWSAFAAKVVAMRAAFNLPRDDHQEKSINGTGFASDYVQNDLPCGNFMFPSSRFGRFNPMLLG
ncbi:hypothetical protein [Falsihalocynthiibacter arcticus]|uniref:hypothetical protein n=1 Tax=Falsihalocynthiibacter arcticus TaxID=1579316 RepID=UPI0030013F0B